VLFSVRKLEQGSSVYYSQGLKKNEVEKGDTGCVFQLVVQGKLIVMHIRKHDKLETVSYFKD
jgi:hypothetical protein